MRTWWTNYAAMAAEGGKIQRQHAPAGETVQTTLSNELTSRESLPELQGETTSVISSLCRVVKVLLITGYRTANKLSAWYIV